jgi:hypothetical protein
MERLLQRWLLFPLLALMFLAPLAAPTPARAQGAPLCFSEVPYCILPGPIQDYWVANGGLPVFGLPITEQRIETIADPAGNWTGPVQWFERDRLEDHTADGQGVLAGLLGNTYLEQQGTPWYTFPTTTQAATPAGCRFFAETGHSLCEPFLSYWNTRGGLARFGFPVTQPMQETISTGPNQSWTGTVQYFQRRRMEHHTENAGTPYEVLLGLLGKDVYNACPAGIADNLCTAYSRAEEYIRSNMGQPAQTYRGVLAATQNFENGLMIWAQLSEEDMPIYAYIGYGRYFYYQDQWREGDPERPDFDPPSDNLYAPIRGFGKAWSEDPQLRQEIGWAVERNENGVRATVQRFSNGQAAMIWIEGSNTVYVFGADQWQAQVVSYE